MEGESAMSMMLSKVGAAQYIVLLIYMMTADSIRALAQVRREHSGRHSSPIDPSLFYSSY